MADEEIGDVLAYEFGNPVSDTHTPTHARADVTSTLTSDEAAGQPAPAVRLATERRESDGRFARR